MLRYITFLIITTFKKISTTILLLTFVFFMGILLYLQVNANTNPYPTIFYFWDYFYYIPFIFASLYIGVKIVNIFSDSKEDGSELLIISKPISRVKLIFGKFIVIFIHIITISFISFLIALIFGQADLGKSTQLQIFWFSISIGFGTFITSLLTSAIYIFIATILPKLGTLIASAIVPIMFIIVSAVLGLVSKGDIQSGIAFRYVYNSDMINKQKNTIIKSTNMSLMSKETYDRQKSGWYNNIKYIDIFTQFKSFYKAWIPNIVFGQSVLKAKKIDFKMRSDITFDGLEYKTNKPIKFIFVPFIYEHLPEERQIQSIMIDTKDQWLNRLYEFVELYNSKTIKTGNLSLSEIYENEIIMNVKEFVHPVDITSQTWTEVYNNLSTTRLYERVKIMFKHFVKKELEFYRNIANLNGRKNIPSNWLSNLLQKYNIKPKKKLTESELKSYFFLKLNKYHSLAPFIGIVLYNKIIQEQITNNPENKMESKLFANFKKQYFDGSINIVKKGENTTINFGENSKQIELFKNGSIQPHLQFVPWIPKEKVYTVWITLSLIFMILSAFFYYKTDLK